MALFKQTSDTEIPAALADELDAALTSLDPSAPAVAGPMEVDVQPTTVPDLPSGVEAALKVVRSATGNRKHGLDHTDPAVKIRAEQLVLQHSLPIPLAMLVASGRCRLETAFAIQQRQAEGACQVSGTRKLVTLTGSVVLLIFAVIFGARALMSWHEQVAKTREQADILAPLQVTEPTTDLIGDPVIVVGPSPNTDVELDELGHVVRVTAPNPMEVLSSYCTASKVCFPDSLKIMTTTPYRPGARIGNYQDIFNPSAWHTIYIFRQRSTRRWVAGDGKVLPVFDTQS
jgi:hypothetical protein